MVYLYSERYPKKRYSFIKVVLIVPLLGKGPHDFSYVAVFQVMLLFSWVIWFINPYPFS
jgi:hypothetical protein